MKERTRLGFALLLCTTVISPGVAQKQNLIEPILGTTDNCEDAKARLDNVQILSGSDGVIILVARLGKGEFQRKDSRKRLRAIWSYLHHARQFPEHRIVKAEGDRVAGQGRVDVYANGHLMLSLTSKRNGDIVGRKSCGSV